MREQAELNPTPPTSTVRNTVGKGKEQTSKNSGRLASDAALREYCGKYYHHLLPIIAEKVHQEKMQQEKLKEVKAHLSFEGSSRKNSKIQEESQHSKSRTLDVRDLRRRQRSRRSHSISESPERNPSVFSRIRPDREHHHEIRKHSPKAKIAEVDTRSLGQRRKNQALKKMNSLNHGYARKQIPSYLNHQPRAHQTLARQHPKVSRRDDEGNHSFSQWRSGGFQSSTKESTSGLDKGKFKGPPPMTTPMEKRNSNRSCEFHGEVWHNTDECIHLKRQIKELVKIEKLSHVIKKVKRGSENDQPKITKKGETSRNDKPLAILMDQPWLRPKVKNQMVLVIAPLMGFSGEIIWPMGQILLPVKIGDVEHFTSTWMNFVIVRSSSSYNRIIGRPGDNPTSMHNGLRTRSTAFRYHSGSIGRIKVAIHPKYSEQTVTIGSTLTEEERKALCNLLRHSLDVFAWKPADMIGVPRHIVEHILNSHGGRNNKIHGGDIQNPEGNKHEAKPKEMHLRNREGHVPGIQNEYQRNNEKSLPFFKTLKKCTKKSDFQWIAEVEAAFKEMKILIAKLPTLTAPIEREQLIVYLMAAQEAYRPRTLVKGQILADFIVERPEDDPLDMPIEAEEELPDPWTLFMNGSSCVDGSGAGLILTNPEGAEFTYALRFRFDVTNNEAEYEALIAGLRIAEQMGVKNLQANMDSRLVANRINGSYIAKEPSMIRYLEKVLVKELKENFINEAEVLAVMEEEEGTWMTPIYNYLKEETLLAKKENARAIRRKSGRTQAVIPAEIGMPTMRTAKRASSNPRSKEQGKMEKYYNSKVLKTSFKPGDLVYMSNEASHAKESRKLSPKWQGPYEVMKALGNEAYKLKDGNRKLLPRTWNVCNLKKYDMHEIVGSWGTNRSHKHKESLFWAFVFEAHIDCLISSAGWFVKLILAGQDSKKGFWEFGGGLICQLNFLEIKMEQIPQ
nr:reverse transcriptase domain-containing protein [Tanacetum cinerariifolium]